MEPERTPGENQYQGPWRPIGEIPISIHKPGRPVGENQIFIPKPGRPVGENQIFNQEPWRPTGENQISSLEQGKPDKSNLIFIPEAEIPASENQIFSPEPWRPIGENQISSLEPVKPVGTNHVFIPEPETPAGGNQIFSTKPETQAGENQIISYRPGRPDGALETPSEYYHIFNLEPGRPVKENITFSYLPGTQHGTETPGGENPNISLIPGSLVEENQLISPEPERDNFFEENYQYNLINATQSNNPIVSLNNPLYQLIFLQNPAMDKQPVSQPVGFTQSQFSLTDGTIQHHILYPVVNIPNSTDSSVNPIPQYTSRPVGFNLEEAPQNIVVSSQDFYQHANPLNEPTATGLMLMGRF